MNKKLLLIGLMFIGLNINSIGQVIYPTIPASNLITHLPFEGNINDASGNFTFVANNVDYVNSILSPGNDPSAIVFNGDNSTVTTNINDAVAQAISETFSVGAWVKINDFGNIGDYMNIFEVDAYNYFRFFKANNGIRVEYGYLDQSGNYQFLFTLLDEASILNQWIHVAMVSEYNSVSIQRELGIFVNGVSAFQSNPVFSSNAAVINYPAGNYVLAIGHRDQSTDLTLNGEMKHFTWHATALPPIVLGGMGCFVDATITEDEESLVVLEGNFSYEWFECMEDGSKEPITGETFYIFSPEETGSYGVEMQVPNNTGCVLETDCFYLEIEDDNLSLNAPAIADITVFPVPASDVVFIEGLPTNTRFYIMNSLGQEVSSGRASDHTVKLDVSGLNDGYYVLKTENGTTHRILIAK